MSIFKIFQIVTVFVSLLGICAGQQANFSNPIDDLLYVDPASILHLCNNYYVTVNHMVTNELLIYKSASLSNFRNTEATKFRPFEKTVNGTEPAPTIWGPKMHVVDGQLYLYIAHLEDDGTWRQYGMRAKNSSDPMGEWDPPVEVLSNWNLDAIDGTILEHGGKNYLVWNDGHSGTTKIYIAELTSPLNATGPYVVIKTPSERWECQDRCTSEAPAFFYGNGRSFMVITTGSIYHSMIYSSIAQDRHPMDPNSWEHFGVIYDQDMEERVYGPSHASFTDSPDGTEVWMFYAATWVLTERTFYNALEKIDWNPDGSPIFPRVHGYTRSQPIPSGDRVN